MGRERRVQWNRGLFTSMQVSTFFSIKWFKIPTIVIEEFQYSITHIYWGKNGKYKTLESGETTKGYLDRQHQQGCQSSLQWHTLYPEKQM